MRTFGRADGSDLPFGGRILGRRGAIATEHHLSAQAGMDILRDGGNAIDAAVAAVFVESVVNPHMFGIGGECPMLIHDTASGQVVSINGNTAAPRGATIDAYRERGVTDLIPAGGILSAGVPAALGALMEASLRFGKLDFDQLTEAAHQYAKYGFAAHPGLIDMDLFGIRPNRDRFESEWPATGEVYLTREGEVPPVGAPICNRALDDLLQTLTGAALRGGVSSRRAALEAVRDEFYRGEVADAIAEFSKARDGFLTHEDLESFETRVETPLQYTFGDATVYKCGPWCQGPVFLQTLALLEGFDLAGFGHNSADYLHHWIEAAKLAFADREQYYGDPEQVDVPLEQLLAKPYNHARRQLIDPERADGRLRPGDPRNGAAELPSDQVFLWKEWGFGTVHVAVIDADGNMAACTPSGGWISGNELIPSLGIALTSRLQTFYLDERHPNRPAPGKRPRTTLTPSIAFRRNRPWMAFGTMGGDQQDQWQLQFFLNRLLFDMTVQQAIEAPKVTSLHFPGTFHPHSAFPRKVQVEARIPGEVVNDLRRRGHDAVVEGDWTAGYLCAVERHPDGLLEAGADPRGSRAGVFPATALAW